MPHVPTAAVGANRAPESGIDIGVLVALVADTATDNALYSELATWYCHPSGFFAGRGTPKNPDPRPLVVPIADIAAALDAAWRGAD